MKTVYILGILTLVELLIYAFGRPLQGVCVFLWLGYGVYKLFTT